MQGTLRQPSACLHSQSFQRPVSARLQPSCTRRQHSRRCLLGYLPAAGGAQSGYLSSKLEQTESDLYMPSGGLGGRHSRSKRNVDLDHPSADLLLELGVGMPGCPLTSGAAPDPESLSAISSYSGRARKLAPSLLLPQTVARRNWDGDEEVMSYREREQLAKRRKPEPPGVPGKLHDMRTIFLTAPISKPVVEVVVAQMLHMALHDTSSKRTEPILIAINSEGTQNERGEAIASDVEPFAILDVMMAINPRTQIKTLVMGRACGYAAMLLAAGVKGGRLAWPNSSVILQPPVLNGERAHVPNLMRHAQELRLHASKQAHYIGIFTGRGQKEVFVDCGRSKHMNPREAIDYGIIDRIYRPPKEDPMDKKEEEPQLDALSYKKTSYSAAARLEEARKRREQREKEESSPEREESSPDEGSPE